ncbi:MAG: hypothetical protein ACOC1U_01805 [Spirochaetota bacterium]
MKYKLLNRYYLSQDEDRVEWLRIFRDDKKLMMGNGVYRDDVLVLLFPKQIDDIVDLPGLLRDLEFDALPEWNKTRYLVHMGNANQGYPVQEAIATSDGRELDQQELDALVGRIEEVFR